MNKRRKIAAWIILALAIVWNLFIMYQSFLDAAKSTVSSNGVADTIETVVNTIKENTINDTNRVNFHTFVRKFIGHFMMFVFSGILLTTYFGLLNETYDKKYLKCIPIVLGFGLLMSASTEFVQLGINGRSGEITDALIDFTGYLLGSIFVVIIFLLIANKKIRGEKNEK